MEFLGTALALGLLSSLHCIGMCGPIALALPLNRNSPTKALAGNLLYQLGRISTYVTLGLIFGLLGKSLQLAGFQKSVSIGLGLLMIVFALLPARIANKFLATRYIYKWLTKLKGALGGLLKNRNTKTLYLIGLLNGLLPCGMVYLALAGAIASGTALNGALFMLLFGLGTTPLMIVGAQLGNFIKAGLRTKLRKALPYALAFMGVLFVLRGLELGIPYISPAEGSLHTQTTKSCCHSN